ncbi:MAG TPA: hypothetical protein VNW92_11930, partial [Polyangiaceae bacterium]|nr:hypothetical protein [Polyangiaceae bacterium]
AGFSAPTPWAAIPYPATLQLRAAQNGVFVVDSVPQLNFHGTAGAKDYDFYLSGPYVTGVADPAGRYVALPSGDKLQVFSTAESGGTTEPPTKWAPSVDDCDSILAWDSVNERIACDARVTGPDGGTEGEVRLFSLNGDRTITAQAIRGLSTYEQGASSEHRRSFSSGGNWFAFATDSALYIADAHAQSTPQLLEQVPRPVNSQPASLGALAFSPNEELLLWQVNGQLAISVLHKNAFYSFYAQDPLLDPEACQEDFPAGPEQWCGRPQKPEAPAWAPDSRFAAALTAAHAIRVFDFGQYVSRAAFGYSDACTAGCGDDFSFQP